MHTNHQTMVDQISKTILDKYKGNRDVVGIFIIGSAAQNTFDEYSDIDFFIILEKTNGLSRENFLSRENINVETLFNTVAEVQEYLHKERTSLYRNTSHMLARGKLLYSSSNVAKQLQLKAQDNLKQKTTHSDSEVVMNKYSINDFLEDVRRDTRNNDIIAFHQDSSYLIQNCIELVLRFNGSYNLKPKSMPEVLAGIDKYFVDILINFYQAQNLHEKLKLLEQISEHVVTVCGGKLPSNWSLKREL